ncbi:MAG: hypothetical protein JWL59_4364 [Chthoniobacteraceae bacterium]|nr:hypothetical protein [Chthoniobacteraceae bacterium]
MEHKISAELPGVKFEIKSGKWRAFLYDPKECRSWTVGYFKTRDEALRARDLAALKHFGNSCPLNFEESRREKPNQEALPQVCARCKGFAVSEKGRFVKSREAFGKRRWLCTTCLTTPAFAPDNVTRPKRRESPVEKRARMVLLNIYNEHMLIFVPEYQMDKATFDFAIPSLKLLIEIDSKSYHSSERQKKRDRWKTAVAKENEWTLFRIQPCPKMELKIERAVLEIQRRILRTADAAR